MLNSIHCHREKNYHLFLASKIDQQATIKRCDNTNSKMRQLAFTNQKTTINPQHTIFVSPIMVPLVLKEFISCCGVTVKVETENVGLKLN